MAEGSVSHDDLDAALARVGEVRVDEEGVAWRLDAVTLTATATATANRDDLAGRSLWCGLGRWDDMTLPSPAEQRLLKRVADLEARLAWVEHGPTCGCCGESHG